MKAKYVSYLRVSTGKQAASGLGIEAQREAVVRHLRMESGELVKEFIEVESGKHDDRKELAAALKLCRLTGAVLVVARLDRLSRNASFLVNLMDSKVKFVCCDSPYMNELTVHVMAAVAQQERKLISARTKDALAAAKARGTKLGNPRLDEFRPNNTKNATAACKAKAQGFLADISEVVLNIRQEVSTLSGIASKLNAMGIKTSRGKEWSASQVDRVLKRLEPATI